MADDKKLPRLHELIAVKNNVRIQAIKTLGDLSTTFEKKQHHFTARMKTFTPIGENTETIVEEQLDLQTTVRKELEWIREYIEKAIDASHSVNVGNRSARADIELEDGTVLMTGVPATTLLELEGEMETLRGFLDRIPTLDPAKGFHEAADGEMPPAAERFTGGIIYAARPIVRTRTKKDQKVLTLSPATEKHPAQVQLIPEDTPTGTVRELEWSSMLTSSVKGGILDRVEKLARAIKKARSRANEENVSPQPIADKLIGYILGF